VVACGEVNICEFLFRQTSCGNLFSGSIITSFLGRLLEGRLHEFDLPMKLLSKGIPTGSAHPSPAGNV
jgi:hypothetical protein